MIRLTIYYDIDEVTPAASEIEDALRRYYLPRQIAGGPDNRRWGIWLPTPHIALEDVTLTDSDVLMLDIALREHDNEIIERCARVPEDESIWHDCTDQIKAFFKLVAANIRDLKIKERQ